MDNKLVDYVLKCSKKREDELKYDFMPALLEIIERPAHKAGKIIIWGILFLVITAVMWAAFSRIDSAIMTEGVLQPQGDISIIRAYGSGRIEHINISEGEYVEEGTVLMEYETEALATQETPLIFQQRQLVLQKEMYEAAQSDSLQMDIKEIDEELQPFVSVIIENHIGYSHTMKYLEKELELVALNKEQATTQLKQYENLNALQQVETQKLMIRKYDIEIEKKMIEIDEKKSSYMAGITAKLADINQRLTEVESKLTQISLEKENQKVKAPTSGYVCNVLVDEQSVVTSMQELVSIVPANTPMEVICYVPNKDISDVEMGMDANMKLAAYDYDSFGYVRCKVSYISPSSISNEKFDNVYLVRLDLVEIPEGITITSGLQGSVELKTGERSVLQYFLEPITKGLGNSFKEK